jgi:glycosyltransferase involved in cell wall biosynthesis
MTANANNTALSGLRVAHVVVSDAFAGSERYAVNLATGLSHRGAEVTLIGGMPSAMRRAIEDSGTDVTHWPASGFAGASRRLRRIAPPDVVHAHLTAAEVAATLVFPTRLRTTLISTRHIASRRGRSLAGHAAAPFVRARIDQQLAPSRYVAQRVDGPCLVLPTGVANSKLGAHDEPVVIVAQRLEPEKDTETALRAWAASDLPRKGWELHLAGTGSQEPALRHLARELGVGTSCRFLGHVDDIAQRLASARLMLATTASEAFGLAVVEAMSCGLPVVAAAGGGHLETLGPVEGAALFEPRDHLGAAVLLGRLAEDSAGRAAYGARLRERQRREYSLDGFVDRVSTLYLDVLAGRNARPRSSSRTAPEVKLS